MSSRLIAALFALGLALGGSSCDIAHFADELQHEWDAMITVMTGGSSPLQKKKPLPAAATGAASVKAALSKANGEILHEMYEVVFMREPKNKEFFGDYVDTMNQGASIEGVYNGFVHSSNYRQLEEQTPGPAPESAKFLVAELQEWQKDLPGPTVVDENSGKPLGLPVTPYAAPDDPAASVDPSPRPFDAYKAAAFFGHSSIFTLKRVMGDEAIRLIDGKKNAQELAHWYAKWVVRMASHQIDFGLELRNRSDENFHYGWALSAPVDNLKWEVLNRVHRLLNAGYLAQNASPSPGVKKP